MSLSDISSGMSFANNYNDMINEANVQAISDATQLTAIAQEGADNNALQKQQSDNVGDYCFLQCVGIRKVDIRFCGTENNFIIILPLVCIGADSIFHSYVKHLGTPGLLL